MQYQNTTTHTSHTLCRTPPTNTINANSEQMYRKQVGHYDGTSYCLYQLRMTDSKIKDIKLPFIRKQINIHNRK
jgi:hypothetical protein